jgi:hypothetical protein
MDLVSLFMHLSWKSQPIINILLSTFLQDYTSNHYMLSLPMKQVLVHEVRHCRLKCFLFMIYYSFASLFKDGIPTLLLCFPLLTSSKTYNMAKMFVDQWLCLLLYHSHCSVSKMLLHDSTKKKVFAWRLSGVQIWMNKNEMWMSNTTIWLHKAWVYL